MIEALALGVAVPHRLFAERCLDPPGNGIADPDDCAKQ